jgi:hypothetical protein
MLQASLRAIWFFLAFAVGTFLVFQVVVFFDGGQWLEGTVEVLIAALIGGFTGAGFGYASHPSEKRLPKEVEKRLQDWFERGAIGLGVGTACSGIAFFVALVFATMLGFQWTLSGRPGFLLEFLSFLIVLGSSAGVLAGSFVAAVIAPESLHGKAVAKMSGRMAMVGFFAGAWLTAGAFLLYIELERQNYTHWLAQENAPPVAICIGAIAGGAVAIGFRWLKKL